MYILFQQILIKFFSLYFFIIFIIIHIIKSGLLLKKVFPWVYLYTFIMFFCP